MKRFITFLGAAYLFLGNCLVSAVGGSKGECKMHSLFKTWRTFANIGRDKMKLCKYSYSQAKLVIS